MSRPSLLQRLDAMPDVTKGVFYMALSAFCFAIMNTLVRVVSADLPPLEIAFFRNVFALSFMTPWLLSRGFPGLRLKYFKWHFARAVFGATAMGTWFTAISLLPLANAVALNFTLPLFVVAGAALFMGEKVGYRRWLAIIIGFCGILVILRPGFAEITAIMVLPVIAAVFMALSSLMLKLLSDKESAGTTVLYMNILMTPISLIPALFVWETPSIKAIVLLMFVGSIAILAHLALARSYAKADTSVIMPFDYTRLPFIALFAFLLFGEIPDIWTWVGAGIIAGSACYIAVREAFLAKHKKPSTTVTPIIRDT